VAFIEEVLDEPSLPLILYEYCKVGDPVFPPAAAIVLVYWNLVIARSE